MLIWLISTVGAQMSAHLVEQPKLFDHFIAQKIVASDNKNNYKNPSE